MWRTDWRKQLEWWVVIGMVLGAGAMAQAQARDQILIDDVEHAAAENWIGVVCTPVSQALRSHLGLPERQGLLIVHVAPDSPAAKTGLMPNDILLQAGDRPLDRTETLIEVVKQSGGEEITLELLRAGQEKSLSVKPDKRAGKQYTPPFLEAQPYLEWLKPWVDNAEVLERIPLRLRRIAPGLLWRRQALPEGVSVTVTKEGKQPARITVKEGDQAWQATENDLDELPEKVRPFVADMLGRVGASELEMLLGPETKDALRQAHDRAMQAEKKRSLERLRMRRPPQDRLQRRLERVEQQLQELRDMIREHHRQDEDNSE